MKHLLLCALLCAAPSLGLAQSCTEAEPRPERRAQLLEDLASSSDFSAGQRAANSLWEFWMQAPDEKAQEMLRDGMSRRSQYALEDAEIILDSLVAYCPLYAEGWNQRAFVRYLRQNYQGSIEDIERTLTLEPKHFGALSGKALALMKQGRDGLAKLAITRAIEVHPWLNERSLLDGGQDI